MNPLPIVRVDVHDMTADAVSLDRLARLALRLRRCGYRLELLRPSQALLDLIELAGLNGALRAEPLMPGSTEPRC
jgi:hypothetical protein